MNSKKIKIWRLIAPYWKTHHRWLHNLKYLGFSEEDIQEIEQKDEEEMVVIKELEQEWRASQIHYSDKELLEMFPEAKEIIPEKIQEWKQQRNEMMGIIKKKLSIIEKYGRTKFGKWLWREWVKINEAEKVLKIDNHIMRLKRLFLVSKGQIPKKGKGVDQQEIQQALTVSIGTIASQYGIQLKKTGKSLMGLCPFHTDKNPSFHIYLGSNSFYCYGCQKGGDIITFVKMLYGYSFPEAVKWLNGEK